jgi:WD40 repeat protein
MKTNKILAILFLLTFLMTACNGATPITEGKQESDTKPTPTATLEPTPSPTPAPVALSVDTLSQIALQAVEDLEFNILGDLDSKWKNAQFSPDGAHVIVDTARGIDVLGSTKLDLVHEIQEITPLHFVDGGRLFGTTQTDLALVNYATGEVQALDRPDLLTESGWPPMAISPTGDALVISTGVNTFDIFSLESRETTSFELKRKFPLLETRDILFSPNGEYLIAIVFDNLKRHVAVMINPDTLEEVYEKEFLQGDFLFSTSGEEFAVETTKGIEVVNLSDGELIRLLASSLRDYGSAAHWDFMGNITNATIYYQGFSELSNRVYTQRVDIITYDYVDQGRAVKFFPSTRPGAISQFVYAEDGSQFLTVKLDNGSVNVHDPETAGTTATRKYMYGGQAMVSPDGQIIAVPSTTGIYLLDASTLQMVDEIDWHDDERRYSHKPTQDKSFGTNNLPVSYASLQFIDNEHILVEIHQPIVYNRDYIASEIWNLDTKEKEHVFIDQGNCQLSDDRLAMVCTRSLSGEFIGLQAYEVFEGTLLQVLSSEVDGELGFTYGHQYLVKCFTGSNTYSLTPLYKAGLSYLQADCQPFVSLTEDTLMLGSGDVISINTGEVVDTITLTPEDGALISSMVLNPTGEFALIGKSIYDLNTGELLATLDGPARIFSAAFSLDGYTLIMITDRGVEHWGVTR